MLSLNIDEKKIKAYMDSAYVGSSTTDRAMKRWNPAINASRNEYDETTQQTLVARSRDAYRNDPIAKALIDRLAENVIGNGLQLQSIIDYEALEMSDAETTDIERFVEKEFSHWANSVECDASRRATFQQIQQMAFTSQNISGDCFTNITFFDRQGSDYLTKLQVVESERVANPNMGFDTDTIIRGIQFGKHGDPTHYYVLDKHPLDWLTVNGVSAGGYLKGKWIPAFNTVTGRKSFLHCADFQNTGRPDYVRGVPILAPVMVQLRQLSRLAEAELMASVINAYFTLLLKSDNLSEYGSSTTQTSAEETARHVTMGPGLVQYMPPGFTPEFADPKRPNVQFEPFHRAICKLAAAGVGVPYEIVMSYFDTSYWAARAAMLQFWKRVQRLRTNFVEQFCQPIYRAWFDELVASGRLPIKNYNDLRVQQAYTRANWNGPAKGSIDELKEAYAAKERISIGLSDLQTEAQELSGRRWDDIHKQRVVERAMRTKDDLEASDQDTSLFTPEKEMEK